MAGFEPRIASPDGCRISYTTYCFGCKFILNIYSVILILTLGVNINKV